MGTVKRRNKEIAKRGTFPVAVVEGDGMSPTVSFKKDPKVDVLVKT